ncbi:MAG TPA: SPASM domain-containing protein [Bacilli bacterium]|nr:SPASM domain-containing protein [Bacilli bacterium]HPX83798.1 SPASM domain-containing protein [Bacilli bacterium]HQC73899.1 SPASM domain-containing protein [Bacilli bacterium]
MNELVSPHFKRIYVEITNVCQLACTFCLPLNRPKQFMTTEQFRRVLSEVKPYTDYLYWHVKGEPLLHPKLRSFLDLALEKHFQINLTTNGLLLFQHHELLSIHPAIRQINLSLHVLQELPETERKNYLQELIRFLKTMEKVFSKYISLRFWLGNNPLKSYVIEQLNAAFNVHLHNDSRNLFPHVYLDTDQEFVWPEQSTTTSPFVFCRGLKDHIAILVDGSVVPCCLDGNGQVVLGNVFSDSLKTILAGSAWKKLREAFKKRQNLPPLCQHCSYKDRFAL